MKNLIALTVFSLLLASECVAQKATLHVKLAHSSATTYYIYFPGHPKDQSADVPLEDGQNTQYNLTIKHPEFVSVYFSASNDRSSKRFSYRLYLSPGDDLELTADFDQPGFDVKVTGKGSNNNQPLIGQMTPTDLEGFYGDTLPGRVINVINADRMSEENTLNKYIKLYNPSPSFISAWRMNIDYLAPDLFYDFKEENKFRLRNAYKRNYDQWQKVSDSLFSVVKLNNDAGLAAAHYTHLLRTFLLREKERLWTEAHDHPETFYREWYNTDTTSGKKLFNADPQNLMQAKVIGKYFTGRSAEYLYAVLFGKSEYESDPNNIPELYARFKSNYPNSEYIAQFDSLVNAITARQSRPIGEKVVFMPDNGANFNSLDDVLAAMKGKTVLVDMWGTWCGPCRSELEKNTAAIHEYFKDKNLYYLYIANHESGGVDNWKKLISYFNLEGMHIIANKHLTDNIMARVKGDAFPTVFIIKKDGSFELSKSPYPINRGVLEKQLDEDLAR